MDKDVFAEIRLSNPQGVIDNLIAQTGRQGKAIYDLNKKLAEGTLQRLEKWKSGHKARSAKISIDDGYGATCWVVELWGKGKKLKKTPVKVLNSDEVVAIPLTDEDAKEGYVYAAETSFFEYDKDKLPNYVVYVIHYDSEEDWPGLEAVINAAIDKAEGLGL